MAGQLPASWAQLWPKLQFLDLDNNTIHVRLPSSWHCRAALLCPLPVYMSAPSSDMLTDCRHWPGRDDSA